MADATVTGPDEHGVVRVYVDGVMVGWHMRPEWATK